MPFDKNLYILVVDDYATMRSIIRSLLKQLGFNNVEEATEGGEAFRKLHEKPYGLIISDWNMKPVNGLDLLKQLRADEKLKDTPFIMVSSESKPESIIIAKQAGVSNYIIKPFNAATLKAKMVSLFGEF